MVFGRSSPFFKRSLPFVIGVFLQSSPIPLYIRQETVVFKQKLTELLHISPRHVYAVGDHANDIPMLRLARQAFAPANAIEAVRSLPCIRVLPHCRDNAIAAMVRALDAMY